MRRKSHKGLSSGAGLKIRDLDQAAAQYERIVQLRRRQVAGNELNWRRFSLPGRLYLMLNRLALAEEMAQSAILIMDRKPGLSWHRHWRYWRRFTSVPTGVRKRRGERASPAGLEQRRRGAARSNAPGRRREQRFLAR
jgi:hypothetical protein